MALKPTEAELEILNLLWNSGPSTVRQLNDQQSKRREIGYTTTLKIMQIMHQKGLLKRIKEGKLHIYEPNVSKKDTQNDVVKKLADGLFQGSALRLAMHALGSTKSSKEDIEEVRAFLNSLEDKNNKDNE